MRKIQIHWSFVLAAAFMVLTGWAKVLGLFVLFVTLHEASHMAAAKILGAKVSGLRVTAIGEAAVINGIEELPVLHRYIIFLAGPGINFFIAALSFLFGWRGAAQVNLIIGFFNLLPVFPLDGGRVAQQFFSFRMGTLRGNRLLTRLSRAVGLAVMAAGVAYAVLYPCNIVLLCVGKYIRQRNKRTLYPLTLAFYLQISKKQEIKKGVIPIRLYAAYSTTLLSHVLDRLDWDHITHILVDNRPENILTEADFVSYVLANGLNGTVGDAYGQR